ncbi:MAG: hypothetical protein MAG551_02408 [Candidatus Scalindua arabica]|uniref:Uncharacterized protein n=1 Tax=Candidatus Scalindua arabica TaxID=1127984 RepID=A0A941W4X9_9BACT|nr:hypothetical protein [Candidatus Scalindua arabica]
MKKVTSKSKEGDKSSEFYNDLNKRRNLKEQLQYESNMVKNNSLEILDEFEKLEDEIIE